MAETSGSVQLPDRLPGLDIQTALTRLDGDVALYLELVDAYAGLLQEFAGQFRLVTAGGKAKEAMRSAHTLKGAAGTIGAHRLEGAAKALEDACKQEDVDRVRDLLPAVERAIAEVLGSLAAIDTTNGETSSC